MARYSALLGKRVEVYYRAGDIYLPATGTLVADSGKSIVLEEHHSQRGKLRTFRWEIPYACIVRVTESASPTASAQGADLLQFSPEADEGTTRPEKAKLPFKNRPEEA